MSQKKLEDLLCSLFNQEALLRWVELEFGTKVVNEVRSAENSMSLLVHDVASVSQRLGLIDQHFFVRLCEYAPMRTPDIAAVRSLFVEDPRVEFYLAEIKQERRLLHLGFSPRVKIQRQTDYRVGGGISAIVVAKDPLYACSVHRDVDGTEKLIFPSEHPLEPYRLVPERSIMVADGFATSPRGSKAFVLCYAREYALIDDLLARYSQGGSNTTIVEGVTNVEAKYTVL